jgi:dihydrodipicolinate synthase/N-acetylneuraminate lyase
MTPPLSGIVPPLVTPLKDRDTLDVGGLERLIEHVIAGGVHGIFILGTTGEGPALSHRLRRELIGRSVDLARGRVPVLVGVTDTSFVEAAEIARHAGEAGAWAIVTAAPYYFWADQDELIRYVDGLMAESPLPLMLYNIPILTKVCFEPETVARLVDRKRIIGIKDTSGDFSRFDRFLPLLKERPDWTLLMGPENLMAESVMKGGHGGVNGGANLRPRLLVDLYDAACAKDTSRVAKLQEQVMQLGRIYRVLPGESAKFRGLKCALSVAGICDDFMTEPFRRFEGPDREKIRALLTEMKIVKGGRD